MNCPYCGADYNFLKMSTKIKEDGSFHGEEESLTLFCENCGASKIPAAYDAEGARVVMGEPENKLKKYKFSVIVTHRRDVEVFAENYDKAEQLAKTAVVNETARTLGNDCYAVGVARITKC